MKEIRIALSRMRRVLCDNWSWKLLIGVGSIFGQNSIGRVSGRTQGRPYLDQNGMLWVCNQTNAQLVIVNTADNTIDEAVATNLNPAMVTFADEEGDSEDTVNEWNNDDDDDDDNSFCFINTIAFGAFTR